MTDNRETVVADILARVTELRTWADGVITDWDAYAGRHSTHPGYTENREGWVGVRDGVRDLCDKVTTRTDDSRWMTKLDDDAAAWTRAATRLDDAADLVTDARLRAVDSWTRGASDRYRDAIPGQRAALARAHEGLTWVATGCTGAVAAGLRHLTSIRDTLDGLVLPESFEPFPTTQYDESRFCLAMHPTDADVERLGRTPLHTAEDAVREAWTTLREEVRTAFSAVVPEPGEYGPYAPVPIAEQYEDATWPSVGA